MRCRLPPEAAGPVHDGRGLVNELVEVKHQLQLRRVMARWSRYDLIAIYEVGYLPLAEVGAEFLPSDRRTCRKDGCGLNHEPTFLGMDASDSECPVMQSPAGSHHRSSAHRRNLN